MKECLIVESRTKGCVARAHRGARRWASSRGGFTLVELLVGMAIFMLMITFVVKSVTDISQTAYREDRKMDGMGEARTVLDRIGLDWAARVQRADVAGVFGRNPEEIRFMSQVQGYEGDRTLAAVSYRMNPATHGLERGLSGYSYFGSDNAATMTFPEGAVNEEPFKPEPVPNANYEPLSDAVFRLDFSFIRKSDGKLTRDPAFNLTSDDCAGIVVAVATLDRRSRQMIDSTSQMTALAAALPQPADDGNAEAVWKSKLLNAKTVADEAGVPLPVAAAIRVDQRIFLLQP